MPLTYLHPGDLDLIPLLVLLLVLIGLPVLVLAALVYGMVVIFRRRDSRAVSVTQDERGEGDS